MSRQDAIAAPGPDLPLPGDWRPRRLLGQSLLAWALFLLVGWRHGRVYGGSLHWLFDLGETMAFVAATLLAGVAFIRCLRQASSLPSRFLLGGGLWLVLAALLVPTFLSSDLHDYLARGRVEVLGHNPYVMPVAALADDPAMQAFAQRSQWNGHVMPYGPVAALLQWAFASIEQPWFGALLWKLLTAAAHVGTALLLGRAAAGAGGLRDGRRALVAWLWNPWLLLESCSHGHNDAFVALGLAAMAFAWQRGRHGPALLGWSLGAMVKHGALPLLPLLCGDAVWRRRTRALLLGALLPGAIAVAAYFRYWTGPGGFDWLIVQGSVARSSLSALAGRLAGESVAVAIRTVGVVLVLAILALALRSRRELPQLAGWAAVATVAFVLFTVPNFAPWYHLWWLPLSALALAPTLQRTLELLAFLGPLSYLVLVATWTLGLGHQVCQFVLAGLWPALLVLTDWRGVTGELRRQPD